MIMYFNRDEIVITCCQLQSANSALFSLTVRLSEVGVPPLCQNVIDSDSIILPYKEMNLNFITL